MPPKKGTRFGAVVIHSGTLFGGLHDYAISQNLMSTSMERDYLAAVTFTATISKSTWLRPHRWVQLMTYLFCILRNFRSIGRCVSPMDLASISFHPFGVTSKHLLWSLTRLSQLSAYKETWGWLTLWGLYCVYRQEYF